MPFRSTGVNGYVGKRSMLRRGRKGVKSRRLVRKKRRFSRRIQNVMDKTMLQKNVYSVITPYQAIAAVNTVGTQVTKTLAIMNSGGDINAIEVVINGHATSSAKTSEFNVDSYILKIAMKNQEQTNAIIDLYEVVPRISTIIDPSTHLGNVATDMAGTGAATVSAWGSTPFQYPIWCESFKILKKTRYLLAPGACEIVEARETRRKRIDLGRFKAINNAAVNNAQADPKYTKYWLVQVYGEPTNDSVNVTDVNTSSFKIDFVVREDYHYSWLINNMNPDNTLANNLSAVANAEAEILIETGAKITPPVQA